MEIGGISGAGGIGDYGRLRIQPVEPVAATSSGDGSAAGLRELGTHLLGLRQSLDEAQGGEERRSLQDLLGPLGTVHSKAALGLNAARTVSQLISAGVSAGTQRAGEGLEGPSAPERRLQVGDGSFELNGTRIDVSARDSAADIFARIESRVDDVRARQDLDSGAVVFERETFGPLPLNVGADTSGVLAALRLESAEVRLGSNGPAGVALAELPGFEAVGPGSFLINGTAIGVDPAGDTLAGVLARANQLVPGLQAAYEPEADVVTLGGLDGPLTLAEDDSGFLNAVQIAEGTYGAEGAGQGRALGGGEEAALGDFFARLEEFLQLDVAGAAAGTLASARTSVRQAVGAALEQAGLDSSRTRLTTSFGLTIDWSDPNRPEIGLEGNRLRDGGETDGDELRAFLDGAAAENRSGLLHGIEVALDNAVDSVVASLGAGSALGLQLNVRA